MNDDLLSVKVDVRKIKKITFVSFVLSIVIAVCVIPLFLFV